jgi:hypothetical protein
VANAYYAFGMKSSLCIIAFWATCALADPSALLEQAVVHRDTGEYDEAIVLYRQAAATNDGRALDHLGWMYMRGYGVDVDFVAARALFAESARQGHAQGMFNLGRIYAEGLGVPQDYAQAAEHWRAASKAGNESADLYLVRLHRYGLGVPRSPQAAFDSCKLAVERGSFAGKLTLGLFYLNGFGVAADSAKAKGIWAEAYVDPPYETDVSMLEWLELRNRKREPGKFQFIELVHDRQYHNLCAPTAMAMVLGKLADWQDPVTVKRACVGSAFGTGTGWDLLLGAGKKLGQRPVLEDSFENDLPGLAAARELLLREIDAGRPVLIDIREPDNETESAHTVAAVGYDRDLGEVIIHDPARTMPGIRRFSDAYLADVWHSAGYMRSAPGVRRPLIRFEANP